MNLLLDTLTQGIFGLLIKCVIIGGHLSMVYRRHRQGQRQAAAQALDAALWAYVESFPFSIVQINNFSVAMAQISNFSLTSTEFIHAWNQMAHSKGAPIDIDWDTLTPDDTNFLRKNLLQWDDNNPSTEESQ